MKQYLLPTPDNLIYLFPYH